MSPADVLIALLSYAAQHAPEIAAEVERLVASFRADTPELADPPPPDGEATVNAIIDARL